MSKGKIGGFYLRKQALLTFTHVNSVWKIKASLSRWACWWPPLSLSTVPLMGIYSSEDHQPGVILCFPDLNIFLSLSGSSCLFPFSRWGRRLVWETTVIPSAILTFWNSFCTTAQSRFEMHNELIVNTDAIIQFTAQALYYYYYYFCLSKCVAFFFLLRQSFFLIFK